MFLVPAIMKCSDPGGVEVMKRSAALAIGLRDHPFRLTLALAEGLRGGARRVSAPYGSRNGEHTRRLVPTVSKSLLAVRQVPLPINATQRPQSDGSAISAVPGELRRKA